MKQLKNRFCNEVVILSKGAEGYIAVYKDKIYQEILRLRSNGEPAALGTVISNTGSTNISGYLCVIMEYYNETSGNWTYDFTVIDGNLITVNSSEEFGIDTVFNGLLNTDYLSYGNGTYRVYAALYDPYGDVLACDDDTKLEAWWKFEVEY